MTVTAYLDDLTPSQDIVQIARGLAPGKASEVASSVSILPFVVYVTVTTPMGNKIAEVHRAGRQYATIQTALRAYDDHQPVARPEYAVRP